MTDITELAQREKFEAWAEECNALPWGYLKKRRIYTGFYSEHTYTSLWAAWKAANAELVEALEKAQATEAHCNRGWIEAHEQEARAEAAEQRIAELESRTVKLPDLRQIVSGDRYVWSDGVYNYSQDVKVALTAAGIKVEAE